MEDNNCIELGDKTQEKKKFRILEMEQMDSIILKRSKL